MFGEFVHGPVNNDLPGKIFSLPANRGMGITLYTAGAVVKGQEKMISHTSVYGQEWQAVAAATNTTVIRRVVTALEDIAAGGIGKFQFEGICDAVLCSDAENVAAGRYLEVLNAITGLNDDGASRTVQSVGVLLEAIVQDEGGDDNLILKKVLLLGEACQIQAA